MQEVARGGAGDVQAFCKIFKEIGHKIDPSDFGVAATDDQGEGASPADGASDEVDTRFLADSELLTAFIEEAVEHLNSVESNILALEKTPGDSEIINAIFRSFHTVKGIASCTDLDQISKLAHSTENLLDEVRNNRLPLGQAATDVVLAVCDRLERMVDNVQDVFENGVDHFKRFQIDDLVSQVEQVMAGSEVVVAPAKAEPLPEKVEAPATPEPEGKKAKVDLGSGDLPDFMQDADLVAGFIAEAFEHLEAIEINVLELEQAPDDIDIINNIFRPFHTIKGVSGFLNLTTINKLAHSTENLLDDVRNNKLTMSADIIDVVLGVGDYLRSMVQNLSDMLEQGPSAYKDFDISDWIQKVVILQAGGDLDGATPTPAPKQRVAAVTPKAAPVAQAAPEEDSPEDLDEQVEPATAALSPSATTANTPQAKAKIGASIKVDVEKLDGLVNAVGELVIMQAMVRQNPLITSISEPKLNKDFGQLSRITTELQKTAMSMRMVPIRQTFQKMTRLVRDLSKKSGKLVDLIMEGEETEIDRNMVDSIYDPLVHMMRNSVDHGVQKPAEREAVGKPGKGTVKLLAYHKGGNIIIEIIDDGQGLNTAKIRSKAIERGLMGPADNISDHEVNNMIFLPGFSTADQITDVSGRGVGMDVVKKGVEKLRGKCELVSTPGEGTQFLMRLPLTLAIIDGIIVRVGQERYIIPTISVQESMRPKATHYKTVQGQGETIMVRNTLIPIIRLNHVFDVKNSCTEITSGIVVVVENEGRHRALLVDELLGKQEVVIKSLGDYLKDIKGLAGGTILGDGRVGLILDLAGLIVASEAKGPPPLKHSLGQQEAEGALAIAGEIAT
ncbi:MAG: chemotaxis protein CheA [Proteobacteria bacterium]|nr:chemotaxis protein CheA [Pseudomonadota bacterium]MBU1639435.1 chemotaxis protein CheA [Pseudomonadota bacterium]